MRFIKSLLVPFFALVFIHSAAVAEEAKGPNLWSISDEDTTLYIFGTIHILNQEVEWITPAFQEAFANADGLILEISPDQNEPAIIQPLIGKYGLLPAGESIKDRLSEENYTKMVEVLEGLGTPGNALDTMRPWLAGIILSVQVAGQHGFLPEFGVEKVLEESARENNIPIYGLETAEYQISSLASLSDEAQDILLRLTLEEIEEIEETFITMRDLWLAGDVEGLNQWLNEDMEKIPGLAEAILYQRNRNWIGEINGIMEVEGTFVMAVGTGHLVGEQNVLLLLEAEGYEVVLE